MQACLELIERDVHARRYGAIGRPNFMSVYHVINEPAEVLEEHRDGMEQVLLTAERERGTGR